MSIQKKWFQAIQKNKIADVYELIDKDIDVDITTTDNQTGLMLASQNGNLEIARLLVVAGANVNYADDQGFSPLMLADLEATKYLLKAGAEFNARLYNGQSVLITANSTGQIEKAKIINHEKMMLS